MSINSQVIHHKNKADYLKSRSIKTDVNQAKGVKSTKKSSDVEKVDLSKASQKLNDIKNKDDKGIKNPVQVLDKAKSLAKKIGAAPVAPLIGAPTLINKISETNGPELINKPAILFVGGLDLFSLVSSDGISQMAEKIPSAQHFSWGDKDEIIDEVLKRAPEQPVILVGHSLGGDTAMEVANELNSLEHGFRKVDLVVTLDSVGIDNDVVPENVTANLNFIVNSDSLFNDGANIARDNKRTNVVNELRVEGHREIDDATNIQFKIFKAIEKTLKSAELNISNQNAIKNYVQGQKAFASSDKLSPKLPQQVNT